VAVVGAARGLGAWAVISPPPQAGDLAGRLVGKHGRTVDDPGSGRIGQGNLDHIDPEQGRARIAGGADNAAGQFALVADAGGSGIVDDQSPRVRGHHRMGVRAAAGLNLADLDRARHVRDVEDADAAETLGARVRPDAFAAAIDSTIGGFHGHQHQVAHDRHVALTTRADDRTDQSGLRAHSEAIEVDAMIVTGRQKIAGEGHVRVGEAQEG